MALKPSWNQSHNFVQILMVSTVSIYVVFSKIYRLVGCFYWDILYSKFRIKE